MRISDALSATPAVAARGWRGFVDHLFYLIGTAPTTNLRILVTLYIAIRTTEHYMRNPTWMPSIEWIGFILAMAGVDVAQWVAKRKTTWNGAITEVPTVITSTPVSPVEQLTTT